VQLTGTKWLSGTDASRSLLHNINQHCTVNNLNSNTPAVSLKSHNRQKAIRTDAATRLYNTNRVQLQKDMSDWRANPLNVELKSKAITRLLTNIRDKETSDAQFAYYADRLMRILAEEALAHHPDTVGVTVQTPCGPYEGLKSPAYDQLCGSFRGAPALVSTR
jgi:hypothetical protein